MQKTETSAAPELPRIPMELIPRPPQHDDGIATAPPQHRSYIPNKQQQKQKAAMLEYQHPLSSTDAMPYGGSRAIGQRASVADLAARQQSLVKTSREFVEAKNNGALDAGYFTNVRQRIAVLTGTKSLGRPNEGGSSIISKGTVDPISSWPHAPSSKPLTSRAPLSLEVDAFIRRELRKLKKDVPHPSALQRIEIYREAFACLIQHFPEYADTMYTIKREFEQVVEELHESNSKLHKCQTENRSGKDVFDSLMRQQAHAYDEKIHQLELQLAGQKQELMKLRVAKDDLHKELIHAKLSLEQKTAEVNGESTRNLLLASSIRDHMTQTARLLSQVDRLKADNENLQHACKAWEEHASNAAYLVQSDDPQGQAGKEGAKRRLSGGPRETAQKKKAREGILDTFQTAVNAVKVHHQQQQQPAVGVSPQTDHTNPLSDGDDPEDAAALSDEISFSAARALDYGSIDDIREVVFEQEAKLKKAFRTIYVQQMEMKNVQQRVKQLQNSNEDEDTTPRPRWISVTEAFPDFSLNHLATSEEILEEFLGFVKDRFQAERKEAEMKAYSTTVRLWLSEEDLCESDLIGKGKFFIGRGTGPHVPLCLRHHGWIRNKRMKKGDIEQLLKKFWNARRARIRIEGTLRVAPIQEFLYDWLTAETGSHRGAVELAYNIVNVCEAHQSDPDCSMFLKVLRGEISELAMFDQVEQVEKLAEVIQSHDKAHSGMISRMTMNRIMNKFFVAKSFEDLLRLRFALITSCKGANVVDHKALFSEDDDGNQTRFVEMVREQHLAEITSFVVDVEETLRECINSRGKISMGTARTNIRLLDHAVPGPKVDEILAYGCKLSVEELEVRGEHYEYDAEEFLARIRCGVLLKPYSRRDDPEDAKGMTFEEDEETGEFNSTPSYEPFSDIRKPPPTADQQLSAMSPLGGRRKSRATLLDPSPNATTPTAKRRARRRSLTYVERMEDEMSRREQRTEEMKKEQEEIEKSMAYFNTSSIRTKKLQMAAEEMERKVEKLNNDNGQNEPDTDDDDDVDSLAFSAADMSARGKKPFSTPPPAEQE